MSVNTKFSESSASPTQALQATLEFVCQCPEEIESNLQRLEAYLNKFERAETGISQVSVFEPTLYKRYDKDLKEDFLLCASLYFTCGQSCDAEVFCKNVGDFLREIGAVSEAIVGEVAEQGYAKKWLQAYDASRPDPSRVIYPAEYTDGVFDVNLEEFDIA